MSDLRVALVQSDIIPDDSAANLAAFEQQLSAHCHAELDLIVLPEVFTTGFHPRARQHAETEAGAVSQWLIRQASRYNAVITGSVVFASASTTSHPTHFNRLLWAAPGQPLAYYDKRHLFRMAGEHERYSAGNKRQVFSIGSWRVLVQVCYDLRFPVFSRNRGDYDLALYVANWPAARQDHWRTLLKARAIENQTYVIGVNRVGRDVYEQDYAGGSVVYSPEGKLLADAGADVTVINALLDGAELKAYRAGFPAHLDADDFTLPLG
ncbi:amidohydrolase [Gilvimarinus polysaccharolyticus]|uniref:amidohydrolase n=1 Tax=Gilvimarinus polysaccharolyticus TaxID=863921 RepID=UPI0006734BE9|nr:amidohydrolase [Gilvimarinus polysaccharolyticus]